VVLLKTVALFDRYGLLEKRAVERKGLDPENMLVGLNLEEGENGLELECGLVMENG
jgi:hypothetical protein